MSLTPEWQKRLTRLVEILISVTVLVAAVTLWRWYQEGGGFEVIYVVNGVALTGLWAVRRRLQPAAKLATPNPSAWGSVPLTTDEALISLRQQLETALTLDDLRLLAFHLNLHYDNLTGETLTHKILSLLHWCGANGRFPDLLAYLQEKYPRQPWAQPTLPALAAHSRGQRNRENLLNHIQTNWIDGFLKQSIHSEVLKLSLSYRPEAVGQRPWQLVLQQTGQADQPVPPDRSILDIFNGSGRNLLILGAPGSGKTITLLQLAEALVVNARTNPAEPMPIVLNLSSWAREKRPLTDWLVEEMFVQYGVVRDLTRAGIANNLFLYLLDGLDEVASEARAECLATINQFKEAHPTEMVVCSRIEEYEALEGALHLGAAVQIRPLSDEQVQSYIAQEGLGLQAARATLHQDSDLRELARAPLMLSLMTLAYRGLSRADLQPLVDKEARRRHLFDHYVRQMFVRRPLPTNAPYTKEQALQWLANIAWGMVRHDQSVFYIEYLLMIGAIMPKLQQQFRLVSFTASSLLWGLVMGLLFNSIGTGLLFIVFGLVMMVVVINTVFFSRFEENIVARFAIRPVEKIVLRLPPGRYIWQQTKQKFIVGAVSGLPSGSLLGILSETSNLVSALIFGGFWALLIGISMGFINGLYGIAEGLMGTSVALQVSRKESEYREKAHWLIKRNIILTVVSGGFVGLCAGTVFGLIDKGVGAISFGIVVGLITGLLFSFLSQPGLNGEAWDRVALSGAYFGQKLKNACIPLLFLSIGIGWLVSTSTDSPTQFEDGIGSGFGGALLLYVLAGLWGIARIVFGLFSGFIETQELSVRLYPNEGIRRASLNALYMGGVGGLVGGFIDIAIDLIGGNPISVWVGLLIGSTILSFRYGILTVADHYITRFVFAQSNILPYPFSDKKLMAYFDAMHDRILLRRVGGGWIFVHRSLLEYFAGLAAPPSPANKDK